MLPLLIAGGAATLGGNLLNASGQSQGASAVAKARKRQLLEQEQIQRQADQLTQNAIGESNPVLEMQGADDVENAPIQQEIAAHAAAQPATAGLQGEAAQSALAAQAPAVAGDAVQRAAIRSRLASMGAPQRNMSNRLSQLGQRYGDLEQTAGMRGALYDEELANAGNKGIGNRRVGGLLSSLGTGAMGASGFK